MERVAKCDRFSRLKHSTAFPLVFTEHGAIMAANVLNSQRAIEASVYVVRAFVKMREALASHKELVWRLDEMEGKVDRQFKQVAFGGSSEVTPSRSTCARHAGTPPSGGVRV